MQTSSVALDPTIIAAAFVTVVGAVAAGVVSIIVAFGKMRTEQIALLNGVTSKADEIHDLVNGSAHAAAAKLQKLEDQVAALHERIATLQDQRIADAKDKLLVEQAIQNKTKESR